MGAPTLLVDGADPFPGPGREPGISSRLYRDQDGRMRPVPSVVQPRAVLDVGARSA